MINQLNITDSFSLTSMKITIKYGVVFFQLPVKYLQLPVLLIGYIETLIRGIVAGKEES